MKINEKYEITFPNGDVTTVEVTDLKYDSYKFEYLKDEHRKPVTPTVGTNYFHFPKVYVELLKTKKING